MRWKRKGVKEREGKGGEERRRERGRKMREEWKAGREGGMRSNR